MKIGEGLAQRSALSKKITQLRNRINAVVTYTEGEEPAEHAATLLEEAEQVSTNLAILIRRINKTNAATFFDGQATITDALATRDMLSTQIKTLTEAADTASGTGASRHLYGYGRQRGTELKTLLAVNVGELRADIDDLESTRRAIDARLQTLSWETDLLD